MQLASSHVLAFTPCTSRLTVYPRVYLASVKQPNCRRISTRSSRASRSINICFKPGDKYAQEYVQSTEITFFGDGRPPPDNESTEGDGLASGCDRTQQDFVEGLCHETLNMSFPGLRNRW